MTTKFDIPTQSYMFVCVWGCWEYEFGSENEAETAELTHDCKRGILG